MVKADKRVMEAFASPAGRIIAEFLEDSYWEKLADSASMDAPAVYRAQGAAAELREHVELAKTSASKLHST